MSIRYASHGTGIRRSPKTSIILPWYSRARVTQIGTAVPSGFAPAYGATAHAKGAWVEVASSVGENVTMIGVNVALASGGVDTSTLMDIGVGAAGSETVVVPNVAVGAQQLFFWYVPVAIPSGSRVAIRIQGTRTSPTTTSIVVALFSGGDYATTPQSVDIIGIDTATSAGTALSGASGSWTQVTASTAKDYQNVIMVPSSSSTDILTINALYSLGVGAAGSERVIGSLSLRFTNGETLTHQNQQAFPMWATGEPVPAGSRLAVRHNISANSSRYHVCLIGIPYV